MISDAKLKEAKKRLIRHDKRWAYSLAKRIWPNDEYAYFRVYDVFNLKSKDPERVLQVYREACKFVHEKDKAIKKAILKWANEK